MSDIALFADRDRQAHIQGVDHIHARVFIEHLGFVLVPLKQVHIDVRRRDNGARKTNRPREAMGYQQVAPLNRSGDGRATSLRPIMGIPDKRRC